MSNVFALPRNSWPIPFVQRPHGGHEPTIEASPAEPPWSALAAGLSPDEAADLEELSLAFTAVEPGASVAEWGVEEAEALGRLIEACPRLQRLDLSGHPEFRSPHWPQALGRLLSAGASLKELSLRGCGLGPHHLVALTEDLEEGAAGRIRLRLSEGEPATLAHTRAKALTAVALNEGRPDEASGFQPVPGVLDLSDMRLDSLGCDTLVAWLGSQGQGSEHFTTFDFSHAIFYRQGVGDLFSALTRYPAQQVRELKLAGLRFQGFRGCLTSELSWDDTQQMTCLLLAGQGLEKLSLSGLDFSRNNHLLLAHVLLGRGGRDVDLSNTGLQQTAVYGAMRYLGYLGKHEKSGSKLRSLDLSGNPLTTERHAPGDSWPLRELVENLVQRPSLAWLKLPAQALVPDVTETIARHLPEGSRLRIEPLSSMADSTDPLVQQIREKLGHEREEFVCTMLAMTAVHPSLPRDLVRQVGKALAGLYLARRQRQ